jgi:hypothetical protein
VLTKIPFELERNRVTFLGVLFATRERLGEDVFLRHVAVRRSGVVAGIVVLLVVLGSVGAVLAIDLHRRSGGPSAAACVAAWNEPSNLANQISIAAAGSRRVAVYGWMAEETYPGCAVLLVHRPAGPWIAYSRQMSGRTWDHESGLRWGHDSPEGPAVDENARVSPSGLLSLD